MKKLLTGSLVITALFLAGCQGTPATESESAATAETATVTTLETTGAVAITKDGFVPKALTVKVGTKVVFTNNDDKKHWPASDPHPVHTLEPGFDAKNVLATGETFAYTFTKAGVYPFHDHTMPSTRGTITVTE